MNNEVKIIRQKGLDDAMELAHRTTHELFNA